MKKKLVIIIIQFVIVKVLLVYSIHCIALKREEVSCGRRRAFNTLIFCFVCSLTKMMYH